nr:MAG TPA: hypothetical protein [Caudoviricetes sp.]
MPKNALALVIRLEPPQPVSNAACPIHTLGSTKPVPASFLLFASACASGTINCKNSCLFIMVLPFFISPC